MGRSALIPDKNSFLGEGICDEVGEAAVLTLAVDTAFLGETLCVSLLQLVDVFLGDVSHF